MVRSGPKLPSSLSVALVSIQIGSWAEGLRA